MRWRIPGVRVEGFGPRLAQLRKSHGLTQAQLGALVGVSYRMIAHYERPDAQPPGPILVGGHAILPLWGHPVLRTVD